MRTNIPIYSYQKHDTNMISKQVDIMLSLIYFKLYIIVFILVLYMKIYKEDRIVFRDIVALWAHEGRYNDNEEQ